MAYEALKQLEEAELRADGVISEAQTRAKAIIQNARAAAAMVAESAVAEATVEAEAGIEAREVEARAAAAEVIEKSARDCRGMQSKARAGIERAVELVLERIVTASGNC